MYVYMTVIYEIPNKTVELRKISNIKSSSAGFQ